MPKTRLLWKYWLPVLLWMWLIFSASGDRQSYQHSSRLIGPVVHWLFPELPETGVEAIVAVVRKGAHVAEFAVLGMLVWWALRTPAAGVRRRWDWPQALRTVLVVVLYAATDELHQRFVPSRQASVVDVLIDTSGGLLGLALIWTIGRWRKLW